MFLVRWELASPFHMNTLLEASLIHKEEEPSSKECALAWLEPYKTLAKAALAGDCLLNNVLRHQLAIEVVLRI